MEAALAAAKLVASMRPAQIAREIHDVHAQVPPSPVASMRPAQIAREIKNSIIQRPASEKLQ